MDKALVIAIGNRSRGDDGVGLVIGKALQALRDPMIEVVESDGELTALLDWLGSHSRVIIVDAWNAPLQKLPYRRWDVSQDALPTRLSGASSHVVGIAQAIELARALEKLPRRLVVFGVLGRNFEMGEGLSPVVTEQIPAVVQAIVGEVHQNA